MRNLIFAGLVLAAIAAGVMMFQHKKDGAAAPVESAVGALDAADTAAGGSDPQQALEAETASAEIAPPPPNPGFYTEEEYAQFKAQYYCDLAQNTRAQCEQVDRGPDGLEQCLKISQYYTYSRHCGEDQ